MYDKEVVLSFYISHRRDDENDLKLQFRALCLFYPDSNSDLFRAPDNFIETLFRLLLSQQ